MKHSNLLRESEGDRISRPEANGQFHDEEGEKERAAGLEDEMALSIMIEGVSVCERSGERGYRNGDDGRENST